MQARYDTIGVDYTRLRRPDPRIAAAVERALGTAATILNVGAGAGSYEPPSRGVVALEPSIEMIRQRPAGAAPAVQGRAESLPFAAGAFDAAMTILSVHHWRDKAVGLREMRRVARGSVVLLTFDPAHRGAWLLDYLPELAALDDAQMPRMSDYEAWLGPVRVEPVPVPHDCADGFLYAYWRRPEAYLDPRIRSGMSSFWAIADFDEKLQRLEADLRSGEWERRYGSLLDLEALDLGYRLVLSQGRR